MMNGCFVLLAISIVLTACSHQRPEDSERAVPSEGINACVERYEGYVTPETTGVQLWYERLGARTAPTIVLLNGSDAHSTFWDNEFISPFVGAGYQVIRFDSRDNGRSEWLPWPDDFDYDSWTPEDPPLYPLDAHTDDLFGLLDALEIPRAHLVGLSMGGMVAQLAAISESERVTSLALLSTSPSNSFDPELETVAPEFFMELAERYRRAALWSLLQPITHRPVAREMTNFLLMVSSSPPSAAAEMREMVDAGLRHAPYNPRSAQGFSIASAPSRMDLLHRITAPTLVLHGEKDVFFPHSHAVALAENIPGAQLISIPNLGHGLPVRHFAPHRTAMLDNFERGGHPLGERPQAVPMESCQL